MGSTAVAEACCQPVMHSSNEQQGSYFALTSAAVHWCCITAHLYEQQTLLRRGCLWLLLAAVQQICPPAGNRFSICSATKLLAQSAVSVCVKVKVKGQGEGQTLAFFLAGK